MSSEKLETFKKHQYINVETFRKNGVGVKTPVWFAQDGDTLVVRTESSSGKMKRIRNNQYVRIAPCDARGRLQGDWVEARAEILPDNTENEKVNRLVTQKYGLTKRLFDVMGKVRKSSYGSFRVKFIE
ncbi:MAG: PPOX class F420-dependent oxidoreductase [Anaerolineaceae bacterium]|nr:PPOX class F420-dependent oxidoreductase [Anaerolineaceae bacterium]